MDSFILTICIATYNRSHYLKITLSEILSQTKFFNDVEVLVVDGNSEDNTSSIVYDLQKKYSNLSYYKLSQKGGVDKDYDITVQLAKGKYCWLFTDDDLIEKNSVEFLRDKLLQSNTDLLVINAKIYDYNLKQNLKDNALNIKDDLDFNFEDYPAGFFIYKTYPHITFIGCVVIKKQLWSKYNNEEFYGTRFIHVGVISKLERDTKSIFLSKPLIKIRLGNAEWNKITFYVWSHLWPKLIWSFPNITDKIKKSITLKQPWKSLKFLLWYRALECYSYSEFKRYLNKENFSQSKLIAFCISITPSFLPKLIFIFLSNIKKDPLMKYYLGEGRKSKNSWFSN